MDQELLRRIFELKHAVFVENVFSLSRPNTYSGVFVGFTIIAVPHHQSKLIFCVDVGESILHYF